MKQKLFISFSGGKTSAYMSHMLIDEMRHTHDICVLFANTGQEHEKTLEYVRDCDRQYRLGVAWVEAVFDMRKGKGTKHKVVSFETAARKGEPFNEMCKKHGLPNSQFPHCTRELKLYPMWHYLKSIGWKPGSYQTAIGIRADEFDRISSSAKKNNIIYPLVDWGTCKDNVLKWESKQPVRLGIPEHYGNCTWCWKKSFRKLATVANETPAIFDFPKMLESKYKDTGAGFGDRQMFRGKKTVKDIFTIASEPGFQAFKDSFIYWDERLDVGSACGESCEIGADE